MTKICRLPFLVHVFYYEVFVAKNAQPSGIFMERVKDTKTSNIVAPDKMAAVLNTPCVGN